VPEELKIKVSAPGAEETRSAMLKIAAAERDIGQAVAAEAQTGTAAQQKSAAAKKGASEAAHELTMRHATLLRQMAMLSPETAAAAQAINAFQMGLSGAARGMMLVSVGIMAVTALYNRYTDAQAKEEEKARTLLASLNQEYEAYLKIAEAVEKVARAKRGLGAGAGERLAARALAAAPAGVGPETARRAAELAAALGRPVTDEELAAAEAALVTEPEPRGKTERAQARRLFGGLTPQRRAALAGKLGAWQIESPDATRQAITAMAKARLATKPEAQAEAILAQVQAQEIEAGRPITRARLEEILAGEAEWIAPGSIARAAYERNTAAAQDWLRRYPELGQVRMRTGFWGRHVPALGETGGSPLIQIYGDVHHGGVVYKGQESDAAGQIVPSGMK